MGMAVSTLNLADILKYFNIAFWVIVGFLVLIGTFKGYRRGISRQTVRFLTVIASLFLSIYVSKLLYNATIVWLDGQTTEDILLMLESYGISLGENQITTLLNYVDTRTLNFILAIPLALFIVPFIFIFVFIIISGAMLIVHWILSKIFGFSKRRNNHLTRGLGALLGLIQGAVVAVILFAPLSGMLTTVSDVVYSMQEEAPGQEATVTITESYDEYIKPFAENTGIVITSNCGGKLLYNTLSTLNLYEEEYEMTETISTPAIKIYASSSKLSEMDWKNLTEDNKKGINAIIDALEESPYLSTLISDVLNSAATAYNDGVFELTTEGPAADLLGAAVGVFEGINKDSLAPTLKVIKDAYYILSDEKVLLMASGEDMSSIADLLTKKGADGQTVLSSVISKLNSNLRTAGLVTALTKLSITVMADSFGGNSVINEQTYDNIKDGINEILSIKEEDFVNDPQGYVDAISESLEQTFTENGIELDEYVVDTMAEHVAEHYSEVEALTDQQINDIILSYYNAFLETGELPEGVAP